MKTLTTRVQKLESSNGKSSDPSSGVTGEWGSRKDGNGKPIKCFKCNKQGHFRTECRSAEEDEEE